MSLSEFDDLELQAEESTPLAPARSPREVALSLRDAIEQRLKTYNEALCVPPNLPSKNNDRSMNIPTSCSQMLLVSVPRIDSPAVRIP